MRRIRGYPRPDFLGMPGKDGVGERMRRQEKVGTRLGSSHSRDGHAGLNWTWIRKESQGTGECTRTFCARVADHKSGKWTSSSFTDGVSIP